MIQIVAKIDTKSKFFGAGWNGGLNRFRNIVKEIMLQLFAGAKEEVRTEMRTVEDFVHIASCARHLFGKPCHAAPLPFQFLFNKMAKMDVGHAILPRFSCCQTPNDGNYNIRCI